MGNLLIPLLLLFVTVGGISTTSLNEFRHRRSIDLSVAHSLIPDTKLPKEITPNSYDILLEPNVENLTFTGTIKIKLTWQDESSRINLHAAHELDIHNITVIQTGKDDSVRSSTEQPPTQLKIKRTDRLPKKPILVIYLTESLKRGSQCEVEIQFSGRIFDHSPEGLFKGNYFDNSVKGDFLATYFRPNNARRVFPCFDEPSYKVPISMRILRHKSYTILFNTPVKTTTPNENDSNADDEYVIDEFETTPPISTFTVGFVISKLAEVNSTVVKIEEATTPIVKIWARDEFHEQLAGIYEKVDVILKSLKNYWDVDYPLKKLDIVALPGFSSVKPADNWGLIVFKESELATPGYYVLVQELVYQWLGSWATPFWYSDAHVNKAIAGFLSAQITYEIDNGVEFEGKWPMTVLYSIYYEFSKRYPHSRITGMKQETTCSKTELVLRMLNYTIGEETFKIGLQKFIKDREYKTFFGDDVWSSLTEQAQLDKKLGKGVTINDIAGSWITKDRIPVVNVLRNYGDKTATVTQRIYLRERPHDVPEQDKMLWWIPLIVVEQDNLNFLNTTPVKWMSKTREEKLTNLPAADKFIIVNPEEIGPFPVNYDERNWNLLASFLQTKDGRTKIPINTRAKLLHDAWNLAYAGDLSFATALNMTLFMKYEREHLVWNPVFTLIDHIGRHIDMSAVHKKFETYVRMLLTPLYEELGSTPSDKEERWKSNLRSLSKTFLCRAGYRPCIEEAQKAYKKWMDSDNPDEGNPVPNQYICPVFKWGTQEEWEFGLERVIKFPEIRKQSERTYLLKTLAGCPIQSEKIIKLLNITILENHDKFNDNDIFLIFNMLSGGSSGYTTLFNFLSDNWELIKERFKNRESLWDNLISSATGVFTTQEGYDMVSKLYIQRQGEFATAEHIIEKSLKNIKEETKWSDENLPIIEKWLDNYLENVNTTDVKFMG